MMANDCRVLVVGIYLPLVPNHAVEISRTIQDSQDWMVDLRWAAVGGGQIPDALRDDTVLAIEGRVSKFSVLNQMLSNLDVNDYRFILFVDDDIELPDRFLDRFLALQEKHELTLCQPARTHDSYIDHHFVAQLHGVAARQTHFVEIGPLFALARDGFDLILPFDERAPMGWGLDFVWPVQLTSRGRRIGIIDATPVRHALRKPVSTYDYDATNQAMQGFLKERPHLSHADAFVAVETYPLEHAEPTQP